MLQGSFLPAIMTVPDGPLGGVPTAMTRRQMHLIAYLKTGPTAQHTGGWRHPESMLDDILEPSRYENIARMLEWAKFDGCFFADLFGLYDIHHGSYDAYVKGGGQTSFHTAYHLARWLASLDVMSKGRVAWNVVTSATDLEARNAGLDELPPRELRYDRADEVLEACFALWNGWDEGAFVLDKKAGVFADPSKVHYANYQGRWIKTRGPLSIPRSPQGHPVIMQAGSSDRGREFAARWAEVVFTIQRGTEEMVAFYTDIKTRMQARGRAPEECAILPNVSVVIGETESIARESAAYLNSLIDPELNRAATSSNLGADLTKLKEGVTLESLQGNQGMKGSEDVLKQHMKAQNMTLQQVAANRGQGREIVGTAEMVADRLQEVFESGACDGFVVSPVNFPGMFEQFCRSVVPELQRRGLFRTEYTGRTLRENLRS